MFYSAHWDASASGRRLSHTHLHQVVPVHLRASGRQFYYLAEHVV